jgi:tetratricopeptide (TPR) repeat protein
MITKIIQYTILFGVLVFSAQTTVAQKERKYIREGNSYYRSAIDDSGRVDSTKMKKAAELYRKAIEKAPTSVEAKFNLANANFKNRDYESAEREFKAIQRAIVHDTVSAKIYHNLGNSQLMQGKLKESIESYKNALRRNPSDIETKYNLALAQSKMNQMQNQPQDQNQQGDDKNEQDQQDKQQQGQEQKVEEKQAQEQQMQEAKEDPNKEKDDKEKFSKEDAARILEALQNEEQKVQDKINKQNKSKSRPKSTRDW